MNDKEKPYIQLTFHLDSITAPSSGLSLPFTGDPPVPTAPWQKGLKDAQTRFSDDSKLDGNVMCRTYGIGASPVGDSIAVSSTFHPSDGVEYVAHSDHVSTVGITPAKEYIDSDLLPSRGGPSFAYGNSGPLKS